MPKVLLATTCRWISAARIGMALRDAGCTVDAVCPSGHPLRTTNVFSALYRFNGLRPQASFLQACRCSIPDLVAPCDELAAQLLHRLCAADATPASIRQLIQRSVGDAACFPAIESRSEFLAIAQQEGITVPPTSLVNTPEDLELWLERNPLPAVLKADGTSGGEGVQVATSAQAARSAFRMLRAPLASYVVFKRTLVDRDCNDLPGWVSRARRKVSIQPLLEGRDANIAFFAWNGEIVAGTSVEVLQTAGAKGPATVIKLCDRNCFLDVARKIARRFRLSGFGGLDFILEAGTGKAYLLELNPRVTQTCHLSLESPCDLPGALYASLTGEPMRELRSPIHSDTIALFPGAWQSDPSAEVLRSGFHDVPWQQPSLVRFGAAPPARINRKNWLSLKARLRASVGTRSVDKHEA